MSLFMRFSKRGAGRGKTGKYYGDCPANLYKTPHVFDAAHSSLKKKDVSCRASDW
jgi:hypothetical protein